MYCLQRVVAGIHIIHKYVVLAPDFLFVRTWSFQWVSSSCVGVSKKAFAADQRIMNNMGRRFVACQYRATVSTRDKD